MIGLALFGGTFDPFHNGHLAVLKMIAGLPYIQSILIVPTYISPQKAVSKIAINYRLDMLKIVKADLEKQIVFKNKKIEVCDLELKRKGVSWTIDTVLEIEKLGEKQSIYLILGSDSYFQFHKWKNYNDILNKTALIVLKRSAVNNEEYIKYYNEKLSNTDFDRFVFLDNDIVEISSTEIRNKIREKADFSSLVPDSVFGYITTRGLYV